MEKTEWDQPVPRSVFVIENNSPGPIYQVTLPRPDGAVFILAPLINAGGCHEKPINDSTEIERLGLADGSISDAPITFSFTDQADVRWTRHEDRRLEETPHVP
ncbi:hypothetical protein [Streptomyces sp. RLB3-6]|uniref:hypothetical protein n=1 Tax=Streptomyces sp. RLB3-6 TaxID=2594457 RepID=UPI0013DEC685|nr:hypothetical protein [Streptomyces sp. RLB3-6]